MILASDFVQPARTEFPRWVRLSSYAALLALGLPVAKTLELARLWPELLMRRTARSGDLR